MREYGLVPTNLFYQQRYIDLTYQAKHLLTVLRAGPHSSAIGIFQGPIRLLAVDAAMTCNEVEEQLKALVAAAFIIWCPTTQCIYVTGAVGETKPGNDRGRAARRNEALRVPRESAIWPAVRADWAAKAKMLGDLERYLDGGQAGTPDEDPGDEPDGEPGMSSHCPLTVLSPAEDSPGWSAAEEGTRSDSFSKARPSVDNQGDPSAACSSPDARQGARARNARVNGHRHLGTEQQRIEAAKRENWLRKVTAFVQKHGTAAEIEEFMGHVGLDGEKDARGKELLERWNRRMRAAEARQVEADNRETRTNRRLRAAHA